MYMDWLPSLNLQMGLAKHIPWIVYHFQFSKLRIIRPENRAGLVVQTIIIPILSHAAHIHRPLSVPLCSGGLVVEFGRHFPGPGAAGIVIFGVRPLGRDDDVLIVASAGEGGRRLGHAADLLRGEEFEQDQGASVRDLGLQGGVFVEHGFEERGPQRSGKGASLSGLAAAVNGPFVEEAVHGGVGHGAGQIAHRVQGKERREVVFCCGFGTVKEDHGENDGLEQGWRGGKAVHHRAPAIRGFAQLIRNFGELLEMGGEESKLSGPDGCLLFVGFVRKLGDDPKRLACTTNRPE